VVYCTDRVVDSFSWNKIVLLGEYSRGTSAVITLNINLVLNAIKKSIILLTGPFVLPASASAYASGSARDVIQLGLSQSDPRMIFHWW
jgi:hypothetical protein